MSGLKCTIPGCTGVINAFTGLQELGKLRQHMAKKHLTIWTQGQALEYRSQMEDGKTVPTPYVSISDKGGKLIIKRLRDDRHEIHGFGTFFWNMKPKDIVIGDDAWEILKDSVGRRYSSCGDLFGIDISWVGEEAVLKKDSPHGIEENQRGLLVNYGFAGKSLVVPPEDVTVDKKAFDFLNKWRL